MTTDDRDIALRKILAILRSPLSLMSVPTREEAYTLAKIHNVTAGDLLDLATKKARES